MKFVLNTYLICEIEDRDNTSQGGKRYKSQQPTRWEWLQKKKIRIRQEKHDVQEAYCHRWCGGTEFSKFWLLDFYVVIPKRLLDEWNSIHENKLVSKEYAEENWEEIHTVKTKKSTAGLAEWIKISIKGEYCNMYGRNYWGFKDKPDAVFFGLRWR